MSPPRYVILPLPKVLRRLAILRFKKSVHFFKSENMLYLTEFNTIIDKNGP